MYWITDLVSEIISYISLFRHSCTYLSTKDFQHCLYFLTILLPKVEIKQKFRGHKLTKLSAQMETMETNIFICFLSNIYIVL